MNKRKLPTHGFQSYMMDVKFELARQGKDLPIKEVEELAKAGWRTVSFIGKKAYHTAEELEKFLVRTEPPTAGLVGRPGKKDTRRDVPSQMVARRRREREQLKASLTLGDAIKNKRFIFLDILPLCEFVDLNEDRFIPCEMAAVEYSIAHGIHRSMHMFIDPGPIPYGYLYDARRESENSHGVPLEGFELACKDYRHVLETLERFLTPVKNELPLVFAKKGRAETTEYCLHWLMKKAGTVIGIERVCQLEMLINEMVVCSGGDITILDAGQCLETSYFDYEPGTRCFWHDARDFRYCAQNTVRAYALVMSDLFSTKLGVRYARQRVPSLKKFRAQIERTTPGLEIESTE